MKYCEDCKDYYPGNNAECPACLFEEISTRLDASFDAVYHVRNHLVKRHKKALRLSLPEGKKHLI